MDPSNSHEHLTLVRLLFPELASTLDAAHERHRAESPVNEITGEDFDTWLDREADQLRAGALGQAPFAGLPDEVAAIFDRAFRAARSAGERLGIQVPEPESFAAAGVDLARLGARLLADPDLLPVPTPYGLGADAWRAAFRLEAESGSRSLTVSPERPESLLIAAEAVTEFRLLDALEDTGLPIVVETGQATVTAGSSAPISWSLRLVPAGAKPSVLGLGFSHGPHVTLPEILMIQLMRSLLGEPLIDASSFTWLAGALNDGRLAARHVFDESEGVIRVNCREVGNQGPHLGARPPVS